MGRKLFLSPTRYATCLVFALYRMRTALKITVNELQVFLSSQPWNKKEKVRSKGSESGKHCTCTCTSNVASGVENGQVAPPLNILYPFYGPTWYHGLPLSEPFNPTYVLFFVLHRCELRTTCNLFVASAVHNVNAGRPA